jgi:ribosomal protein L11 methyltransferase
LAIYPAIDVRSGSADLIPAIVDDFRPIAIEERADAIRVFFTDPRLRDAAGAALSAASYKVQPVDVDDEDWARRSQENLQPITVGRITIVPSASGTRHPAAGSRHLAPGTRHLAPGTRHSAPGTRHLAPGTRHQAPGTAPGTRHAAPGTIVIQPSMGFGTGHHATTRLCLHALQATDLVGRFVLDVGTGSGVLAIAAVRLGAARALGLDYDADAIQAANENLTINDGVDGVEFQIADLSAADLPAGDIVTANLTGAVLMRSAARLLDLVRSDGTLIVSGLLDDERDDVLRAFGDAGSKRTRPASSSQREAGSGRTLPASPAGRVLSDLPVVWERHEDGWAALAMKRS